ncbi:MAG TPA: YdeI/OmpD-associated family protein [Candidatus Limnocylindria bacterium]|nr:YdeI/OmpD-associated family protein [Candidatus Limnocylindria bacterium]
MGNLDDAPYVEAEDRTAWRAWLEANHATATGAWLVSWRKGHGAKVAYEDAVEEALCFGWIDSQGGKIDERRSRQYFAPRKPASGWAATNKVRIERLIADGRMAPAGLAAIERAKANGSWTLFDDVEQGIVPDDLARSLADHPPAAATFEAFPKSARRAILAWIAQAKRPETRAKRVLKSATLAARNERAYPPERR